MLPEQDRELLAKNPGKLIPAGHAASEHDGPGISILVPVLLFFGLITWGLSALGGLLAGWLATVIWVLGGVMSSLAVLGTLSERKTVPMAQVHHGRYLCGPDFDQTARMALARARRAIAQVQES